MGGERFLIVLRTPQNSRDGTHHRRDGERLETVGVAVAAGVVALMIGAIGDHAKANDIKAAYVGPIFVLVLAALYIIGMSQR